MTDVMEQIVLDDKIPMRKYEQALFEGALSEDGIELVAYGRNISEAIGVVFRAGEGATNFCYGHSEVGEEDGTATFKTRCKIIENKPDSNYTRLKRHQDSYVRNFVGISKKDNPYNFVRDKVLSYFAKTPYGPLIIGAIGSVIPKAITAVTVAQRANSDIKIKDVWLRRMEIEQGTSYKETLKFTNYGILISLNL